MAARPVLPREITNAIGMRLVLIPAGKFRMGSPDSEKDRSADEGPVHEVQITRPFYLSVTPVTQEQYEKVMGRNPSWFSAKGGGKDSVIKKGWFNSESLDTSCFPVESVSWNEAVEFSKRLAAMSEEIKNGRTYRLPTEAEWEYACRGGVISYQIFNPFGNSLSSTQANFDGTSPYGGAATGVHLRRTCKVGSYPANGFGLHDMHGNVWEWCADWYDADYYAKSPLQDPQGPASGASARVLRGGGWFSFGRSCRSADRDWRVPDERNRFIGFRPVAVPSLEPS